MLERWTEVPDSERFSDFDANYVLNAGRQAENRPKLRVAVYIRVSTDFLDQENSYVVQEQYFRHLVANHPEWKLVAIYSDHGQSGTSTAERIGFRRLIRHCKEGKIDRILCKSISRFARNTADFSSTILLLRECNVTIFFEKENMDSADMQSEFLLSVLGAFAQEESRSISSNTKLGLEMRNRQGNAPNFEIYGYRFSGNVIRPMDNYAQREVLIDEDEARVVRQIFELVAEGQTYASIARLLNKQEIPAPKSVYQKARERDSNKGQLKAGLQEGWKAEYIAAIIRNERYVGDVLTNKSYTPNYLTHKIKVNKGEIEQKRLEEHHPGIVDREIYEKVQQILKQRSRGAYRHHQKGTKAFSQRLICGECGRFYINSAKNCHMWYCPTTANRNGIDTCHAESVMEGDAVAVIRSAILEKYELADMLGKAPKSMNRNILMSKVDAMLNDFRQHLTEILQDHFVERDRSIYKGKLANIEQEQENLTNEIEILTRNLEHHKNSDNNHKKQIKQLANLKQQRRRKEREYEKISDDLTNLENYWAELEEDYVLRAEAMQWMNDLPRGERGVQKLLDGLTGQYFRALILEVTINTNDCCSVRWFDNTRTEVMRTKEDEVHD